MSRLVLPGVILLAANAGADETSTPDDGAVEFTKVYEVTELLTMYGRTHAIDGEQLQKQFLAHLTKFVLPDADNNAIGLRGGSLIVRQSRADHDTLADGLERMRRFGTRQFRINIRIMVATEQILKTAGIDLTPVPVADENTTIPRAVGFAFPEADGSPDPDQSIQLVSAQTVTTRSVPVVARTIDDTEARKLFAAIADSTSGNILHAPKVTLFNGQSATIQDTVERPFVVGVERLGDDPRQFRPQIRVFAEGTIIHLRPRASDDETIRIDCRLERPQLDGVDTATVSGEDKDAVSVQIPVVKSTEIQASMVIKPGESILLGGLKTEVPETIRAVPKPAFGFRAFQRENPEPGTFMIMISATETTADES